MVTSLRSRDWMSLKKRSVNSDRVASSALATFSHRHLVGRLVPLQARVLQRQRGVLAQRQLLVLAIQPVAVAPDDASGREDLHIQPSVVGNRIGLVPGLERLERGIGQCHLILRMSE